MKNIHLFALIMAVFISNSVYCQKYIPYYGPINSYDDVLAIEKNNAITKDTVVLFIDNTDFYLTIETEDESEIDYFCNKIKYFDCFHDGMPNYVLKDSLPDGVYYLFNIKRAKAKKLKKINEYCVVSGRFQNRMKQGDFRFNSKFDYFGRDASTYKLMHFKDDIVDGKVIEVSNGIIICLCEYKLGLLDGLFYIYETWGNPKVILFKDGEVVKYSEFF